MRSFIVIAAAVALHAGAARAQAQLVPSDADKGAQDKDLQGWNPFLGVTATLSLVDNSNVLGQVNGFSALGGLGLLGGADYIRDRHLLRTSLVINEGFARTPVVTQLVKTNDVAKLDGQYNYFLTKYLGVYGRLGLATSLFATEDVRGAPTTWVDVTGTTPVTLNANAFSQHLSNAFAPFTITESLGGFADPVRKEPLNVALRLGLGGRSTFADNVIVLHDDLTTPQIEVVRLSDVHQLGAEAFVGATGKLDKGKAIYKAGVAVLLPFVNNDKFMRSATTLTRVAFESNITYKMSSWLSAVYSFSAIRDPQLFPAGKELVQVQNTLLLTFQANLVKKKEKPKAKTKEQLELEAAKKRADDADKRATEAETKLKNIEVWAPIRVPIFVPTQAPAPAPSP
jgi:hypothetical protein